MVKKTLESVVGGGFGRPFHLVFTEQPMGHGKITLLFSLFGTYRVTKKYAVLPSMCVRPPTFTNSS